MSQGEMRDKSGQCGQAMGHQPQIEVEQVHARLNTRESFAEDWLDSPIGG